MFQNKLKINDSIELANEEERRTKIRAIQLFDSTCLKQETIGTFQSLAMIHKYLFEELYEFAGKLRNDDFISGGYHFAASEELSHHLQEIDTMPQNDFPTIIRKFIEMNTARPFACGNGRSIRLWLNFILKAELGLVIDWSKVDTDDYVFVMQRSSERSGDVERLLKEALSDKVADKDMYGKGIDASYNYDGFYMYKSSELAK